MKEQTLRRVVSRPIHWMDLIAQISEHRDQVIDQSMELTWAILAEEQVTLWGRQATIRLEWIDGVPLGKTKEEIRDMARKELARLRAGRAAG